MGGRAGEGLCGGVLGGAGVRQCNFTCCAVHLPTNHCPWRVEGRCVPKSQPAELKRLMYDRTAHLQAGDGCSHHARTVPCGGVALHSSSAVLGRGASARGHMD